jgi:hypothetical protein
VKGLTTEDTEATEDKAKKELRQLRVSKDLDRLLRIYEVSIFNEGPGGSFQRTLQHLIVEAASLASEGESQEDPYWQELEKLIVGSGGENKEGGK